MQLGLPAKAAFKSLGRPKWVPAKPAYELGKTEAQVKGVLVGATLLPLLVSTATAYVGFRLGAKDHGIPSILGYGVGILGSLGALTMLLAALGIMALPFPNFQQTTTESIGPTV